MSRRVRAAGLTLVVGVVVSSAVGPAGAAQSAAAGSSRSAAPAVPQLPTVPYLREMYDVGLSRTALPAAGAGPVAHSVPNFAASVVDHGSTFQYKMVGKNPTRRQSAPSTTVRTVLVPLIIKLPGNGGTYDPTKGNACDLVSAVKRTVASPVFASHAFRFGSTSVGSTQYVDAYQRANFWQYVKPGALNPGYHVRLDLHSVAAQVVNVPTSAAATSSIRCGKLGAVKLGWLDDYLRTTLIPRLKPLGVSSTTFALFLTQNVVSYVGTPSNCCVLGYHNAFTSAATGGHVQTYGVSMYDNTHAFPGSGDVSVLSHEVAEWMDDPFVDNATKPWGHVGQISGCQDILENGDPLSGTVKPVIMGGKTYHVQELAFLSWFFHLVPSIAVNGWYSDYGTFRQSAPACR